MATNPFDQFDTAEANPFDQFDTAPEKSKTKPSTTDKVLRGTALTGRALGEGLASTAYAVPDALISVGNVGIDALNKYFGTQIPRQRTFYEDFSNAMTAQGAPVPETGGEQLASSAIRGGYSGMLGYGLLAPGGTTANMLRSGASGASGATASEATRQAGGGPILQTAAGLAGGFVPAVAEQGIRAGAALVRGGYRTLAPLVSRGAEEQIAANTLGAQATDPRHAAANLQQADDVLPGSQQTAGPASGDVGILAMEKGLRSRSPSEFGTRISEQNAARQGALRDVAGTADDVAALKAARDTETGAMRQGSLSGGGLADTAPVIGKVDEILASPSGQRQSVSSAMQMAKERIGSNTDPAALYEIRKDLQLAQRGKLQPTGPNAPNASTLAQARGELGQVVNALDDAIEAAAPGFKAYLERYKELSKPINQAEVLQEIQRRAQLNSVDIVTGEKFLSADKFARSMDAVLADAAKRGTRLTQEQIDKLTAIRTDLQSGAAINSQLVKAPGSDTFQNLSIANAIGARTAENMHPFVRTLTRPLGWLYKQTDENVNRILTKAMLDPKLAAQLLQRATPQRVQSFATELGIRARAWGIGTTVAQATRPSQPEQRTGSP